MKQKDTAYEMIGCISEFDKSPAESNAVSQETFFGSGVAFKKDLSDTMKLFAALLGEQRKAYHMATPDGRATGLN